MTRKDAYEFYEELKRTGKLKEFQRKRPSEMTKKEQDLFFITMMERLCIILSLEYWMK